VWLAIGWLACNGGEDDAPPPPVRFVDGPRVEVEVTVDDAIVFSGEATSPENGLYQAPAAGAPCTGSRRFGVFKGADVFLEIPFAGEHPAPGSEVLFPATVDEPATDWSPAGWRTDDGLSAAYGGRATLVAFGQPGVEIRIDGATVCTADRIGAHADTPWAEHTSACTDGHVVRFRTLASLPFDPGFQTWCAAGDGGRWITPTGDSLCATDRLPCAAEIP
jgi:hypothetical protein